MPATRTESGIKREGLHHTVSLTSKDIIATPIYLNTSIEFNEMVLVTMEIKDGFIEVLFNKEGELVKQGEQIEAVKQLSAFFNKAFEPITFDNIQCWGQKLIN